MIKQSYTWDESKHPRNEKGKFTFKNGDNSYVKEETKLAKFFDKTTKNKEERSYRSQLIQLLGDKLPIEEKLYATVKELEEMVEKKSGKKNNISLEGNSDDRSKASNNKNKSILYHTAKLFKDKDNVIGDFARNFVDMVDSNNRESDHFFHAKAGCQAAQRDEKEAQMAKRIGDIREDLDLIKNKYKKKKDGTKMTTEEVIKDYMKDQAANYYGRAQGAKNKNGNCSVLVDKYRPNGLDKKY